MVVAKPQLLVCYWTDKAQLWHSSYRHGLKTEKKYKNKHFRKMNFISPYVELPKKLTVKENLIVYGKLYSVLNLNEKILNIYEKFKLEDL